MYWIYPFSFQQTRRLSRFEPPPLGMNLGEYDMPISLISRWYRHQLERLSGHTSLVIMWLAACWLLTGCQSGPYYFHAIRGQWEIETNKTSIASLQSDPDTASSMLETFEAVERIRRFAFWQMALPADQAYEDYVALNRPCVVWNVTACQPFSMEAHQWWYPLVGKLGYRGFFNPSLAEACATSMRQRGYDVVVEEVAAYSTLGWFRDPIFSSLMSWPTDQLAELIFHELAHQRAFLPGETDLNEAFATVVAREGVECWLTSEGRTVDLARYRRAKKVEDRFVHLVMTCRGQLESFYATLNPKDISSGHDALEKIQARKASIFMDFRRHFEHTLIQEPGLMAYQAWMNEPLNNARLKSWDTYYRHVPVMETLWDQHVGDWEGFYKAFESFDKNHKRAVTSSTDSDHA